MKSCNVFAVVTHPSLDHGQQHTTYYRVIYDSKDVIKLKSFLASAILASRQDLGKVWENYANSTVSVIAVSYPQALAKYQKYEHLYIEERKRTISEFQNTSPHFSEYESEMERYEKLEAEIMELPSSCYLNAAIQLSIEPLKFALAVEAKAWKTAYGRGLNDRYRTSMEATVQFVNDYSKKLARPIKVGALMVWCVTVLSYWYMVGPGGCSKYHASPG